MRILLINTEDKVGGASLATHRMLQGLADNGIDVKMLVQHKQSPGQDINGPTGFFAKMLSGFYRWTDAFPLNRYPSRLRATWSLQWFPSLIHRSIAKLNPDIVHLHWIGNGFIPISAIPKINKPIVWTLADQWPMTGGCHYDHGCTRYQEQCGQCHQLRSRDPRDLSHKIWRHKYNNWQNLDLHLVSPSSWIAHCIRSSPLLKKYPLSVIPYGVNLNQFYPMPKDEAKRAFHFRNDLKLLLFVSTGGTANWRKGFSYLQSALKGMEKEAAEKNWGLVLLGFKNCPKDALPKIPIYEIEEIREQDQLARLYCAADVSILASVMDNLPNTVMESLACGTPVVAFNIDCMSDMLEHKHNGYLAQRFDINELGEGIRWVLEDRSRYDGLCRNARKTAEEKFDLALSAQRYIDLYKKILSEKETKL